MTQATANKVATIGLAFWIMKVCATTVGETGGDMLSMTLNIGYAISSLLLMAFFLLMLGLQLRARRFNPWRYWAVILATSTAGTTISDYMDRSLGLGYATGAAMIGAALIAVLIGWRLTTGSIAVAHIADRRSESFYWLAILVSNTLGTALGDYLADSSGLGYLGSNALISAGLALSWLAYRFTSISPTLLFWTAFVLTRPFGATMGDLLTKSTAHGGFGYGTTGASAILLGLFGALILISYRQHGSFRQK